MAMSTAWRSAANVSESCLAAASSISERNRLSFVEPNTISNIRRIQFNIRWNNPAVDSTGGEGFIVQLVISNTAPYF
jgi:hypothetical protein